ncbi:response regulator [Pseudomonas huanghezhanensis]|uniref:response regulator n=1 Tax=Pseudomonas huanghezhanensis TaxID=3002903 RepID=UPI002285634D|nr:response regulator [Pseudomonas sp. BSw22131]
MTTVLIIDDEYLIADILSYALEDEGYLTVKAGSGQKALDILNRESPELIITDYMMPGMNGIELAEAVRRRPGMEMTPMILMSGAQAHLGKARPDLFFNVFEKPFDIDEVVDAVKRRLATSPATDNPA